jgi:hypothetical protein
MNQAQLRQVINRFVLDHVAAYIDEHGVQLPPIQLPALPPPIVVMTGQIYQDRRVLTRFIRVTAIGEHRAVVMNTRTGKVTKLRFDVLLDRRLFALVEDENA